MLDSHRPKALGCRRMSIRTSPWPAGVPCWADLQAPDVAAAKTFYADVLGWTYEDTEAEYGGYVIAQARGAAAAGIGPQQPGAPAAWTLYLASDDVDATAGGSRRREAVRQARPREGPGRCSPLPSSGRTSARLGYRSPRRRAC